MGTRDAWRLGMVKAVEQGRITNREAAEGLGLSVRQFRRLRRQVRERGPQGVVHGNRGRRSPRRLAAEVRERVVALLTGPVKLNDHHLADLLAEDEVTVSPASVRRIRQELKLPPKRRRRGPRHHRRRPRKARRGELVRIDGSPFPWFDGAGPRWSLLGAIDDATGAILTLTLRPTEDLHGYVVVLKDVITTHGVPLCCYGDRSGILIRNDSHWTRDEELRGQQDPTQFGRMLAELGVRFIPARSPQAKGRIERLWATLQDRLAAELQLRGHTTAAAALAYLPGFIARHNRQRAVAPADTTSALRPAPRDLDLILGCAYPRVVARDNTVTLPGRWAQVPPGPHRRSWHKARVEVRELLDGRRVVLHPRHGLIAEQPPPHSPFILESRESERAQRARAQNGSPGSRPKPDLEPARVRTRPRPRGVGTLTQIRRPVVEHPWNRRFSPQGLPHRNGGRGRTKSLTR